MNIATPSATSVQSVSFGTFTEEDVHKLSVIQVTTEKIFDNLQHPTHGGLYDPAMGPLMRGVSCSTCHLDERFCPGHFGHIQLPQPVYHPLFFLQLFALLRGTCLYCYSLRLSRAEVHKYVCRLTLLEHGLLLESQDFADMDFSKDEEDFLEAEESEEEEDEADKKNVSALIKRRERWMALRVKAASHKDRPTSDAAVSNARRLLIKDFLSRIASRPRCDNCQAFSPAFKKDGYAKIFEVPLAGKAKQYMDQHGRVKPDLMRLSKENAKAAAANGELENAESEDLELSEDESEEEEMQATKADKRRTPKYVFSFEVHRIIQQLFEHEPRITNLLYRGERKASPDIFFLRAVLVPPVKFRPAAKLGDQVHENIQNELLSKVLAASNRIREISVSLGDKEERLSTASRLQLEDQLTQSFVLLQHNVNSLIDSNRNPDPIGQNREHPPGIKQVLEKKEGLFRKHMMGKRVNYAARSVISPDPNIETSEIGVPPVFAKKLTYPEPVTAHNYAQMRAAVINGPFNHPGATHIQNEDGALVSLLNMPQDSRTALANQLLTPQNANGTGFDGSRIRATNKKVLRHLRDGDLVLMNRQPTLHKPSIMAHKVRVLTGEKTIRMHYANCNTYNADFDGDEMNMHLPQNENARAEAALIANTDNQYLVPTSGDPLRGLIQDHVVIAVWMTNRDTFFTRQEYHQLLYGTLRPEEETDPHVDPRIITVPAAIQKPRQLWTGKQVITTLLTNLKPVEQYGLNLESKCKVAGKYWSPDSEEGKVIFKDGALMTGILDKSQFGASAYGMVHSIYEIYGPEYAGRLLSMLGRLFTKYSQMRAFTCRMDDLRLNPEGDSWRRDLLQKGRNAGTEASSQYVGLKTADGNAKDLRDRLEEVLRDDEKLQGLDAAMKGKMNKLTSSIIDQCIPGGLLREFPHNHMQTMTVSGAKGSNVNVSQISCLLGQQELEGRRVPIMVSGKTLPSFKAFDSQAMAGGFIAGRFLTGIKPQEYYFHCMAGREGLIDTAVKTSRSGYLQRCLIKHLEGIKVNYDSTVRDADGSLIQMNYGEDSLDVIKQKHLFEFGFSASNFRALKRKYRVEEVASHPMLDVTSSGYKAMKKALKKPEKYDPVLSISNPTRAVGVISEAYHERLESYISENPENILVDRKTSKEDRSRLSGEVFRSLMHLRYQMSLVEPGEAVGILASQSVGEPSTQMTLNTFHFAGFGARNVTLGIPRLREIIMTASASIKTPTMSMKLLPSVSEEDASLFAKDQSRVLLSQLIESVEVIERLKVTSAGESKRYIIQLNLFSEKEYMDEYNVNKDQVEIVIAKRFLRALKDCTLRQIRKAGGKVPTVDDVGKTSGKTKASQDFDENVAHEAGINDEEGEDGDATDAKMHERAKMMVSYEKPDDDEEAIRKEANTADDSDLEDSIDIDMNSDEEAMDVQDGEDKDSYEVRKAMESQAAEQKKLRKEMARNANENLAKFDFNEQTGAVCRIELDYPTATAKLLMVNLVEEAANMTVVQELSGIRRCFRMPSEGLDESRLLATEGVNFKAFWNAEGVISHNDMYSNDIAAIGATYGVEAMRNAIIKEVSGVFAVYGIGVDRRHLSLIADYMTFEGGYKPFNRMGIESNPSPFLKMTYETTCTFLTQASLHGDIDTLDNPSSKIVMGKLAGVGTGAFDVLQDLSVSA
ncbi:DNA-directed RNA polymerase I subunit RPA1 [Protomyces lactucae-debilis]|uniref:DNA-directed RNA polymerase subunit n=1 Tax=Protomyces lactucae-debilis TaxID=2754530 RepID=A0A1Y2F376_PROLT|nr:DNA-directed RNA polymerase I subunit RPA1 [Protomyces lactucae-debilis]ORY77786.1 DNA-directed RNA polymerase I subunit RPA1 [Protomyces lactucae-debilis]